MRIEHESNLRSLQRDWLAAWIIGTLGLLLIAAVAVLATLDLLSPRRLPQPVAVSPQAVAAARRQEDIALCDGALTAAQKLGVLPAFAVREGDVTRPGGAQGRYVCGAKTDAAHYAVTFDLACTQLGRGNCIVPFDVTQDGTSIYRRK